MSTFQPIFNAFAQNMAANPNFFNVYIYIEALSPTPH